MIIHQQYLKHNSKHHRFPHHHTQIEFLFEKDGCKMYRFKDGGRYIYWSNCDGRTEYSYYRSTGKSGYTAHEQSVASNSH